MGVPVFDYSKMADTANKQLFRAIKSRDLALVKRLIKEGADPSCREEDDYLRLTPLHTAAFWGDLAIVKYLVEEEGVEVNARDSENATPLHRACQNDQLRVVEYFIRHRGCDIETQDKDGWRALHWASVNGSTATTQWLLFNAKCNPVPLTHLHYTPLDWAVDSGHLDTVSLFTSFRDDGGTTSGKYI